MNDTKNGVDAPPTTGKTMTAEDIRRVHARTWLVILDPSVPLRERVTLRAQLLLDRAFCLLLRMLGRGPS